MRLLEEIAHVGNRPFNGIQTIGLHLRREKLCQIHRRLCIVHALFVVVFIEQPLLSSVGLLRIKNFGQHRSGAVVEHATFEMRVQIAEYGDRLRTR